jgi:hypothetical protein
MRRLLAALLALSLGSAQALAGISAGGISSLIDGSLDTVLPTQVALYTVGQNIGGLVTFALPRLASGTITELEIKSFVGSTAALTAYCFTASPTASTITDKATFVLGAADLNKLVIFPQVLTPSVNGAGSTSGFMEAVNTRRFQATNAIYCAYVVGAAGITPASATDIRVGLQFTQNAQ